MAVVIDLVCLSVLDTPPPPYSPFAMDRLKPEGEYISFIYLNYQLSLEISCFILFSFAVCWNRRKMSSAEWLEPPHRYRIKIRWKNLSFVYRKI